MATPQSPPASPRTSDAPTSCRQIPTVYNDIPYSREFSDNLMHTILHPESAHPRSPGIRIGDSARLSEIDSTALPQFNAEQLPIPLDDSRRLFASNVPGVRLTHPGGWVEGGIGPGGAWTARSQQQDPQGGELGAQRDYTLTFINRHSIRNSAQLDSALAAENGRQLAELKRRMKEREEAIEENERIDKEIQDLERQRAVEKKVEEKMRAQMKRKSDS